MGRLRRAAGYLGKPDAMRRFELVGALSAGGSASAKVLRWTGAAWSATAQTFVVRDLAGVSANSGDKGIAVKVFDAGQPIWVVAEIKQTATSSWASIHKSSAFTLGTTTLDVVAGTGNSNGADLSVNGTAGTITINTLGDYRVSASGYVELVADTTTNIQASLRGWMQLANWSPTYGNACQTWSGSIWPSGFTTHDCAHYGFVGFNAIGKNVAATTVLKCQARYDFAGCVVTVAQLIDFNFSVHRL